MSHLHGSHILIDAAEVASHVVFDLEASCSPVLVFSGSSESRSSEPYALRQQVLHCKGYNEDGISGMCLDQSIGIWDLGRLVAKWIATNRMLVNQCQKALWTVAVEQGSSSTMFSSVGL